MPQKSIAIARHVVNCGKLKFDSIHQPGPPRKTIRSASVAKGGEILCQRLNLKAHARMDKFENGQPLYLRFDTGTDLSGIFEHAARKILGSSFELPTIRKPGDHQEWASCNGVAGKLVAPVFDVYYSLDDKVEWFRSKFYIIPERTDDYASKVHQAALSKLDGILCLRDLTRKYDLAIQGEELIMTRRETAPVDD